MEFKVIVRDFDPKKDLQGIPLKYYNMGFDDCIKQFNQKLTGSYYNDNLQQKEGETIEQYTSRLRNDIVELLCSNRGYASCFPKK